MSTTSSVSGSNAAYYQMQKNMFSKTDSDSDGKVTESEFVSARPKEISEEQASKLYASIDTEGTGSISFDQFSSAVDQAPESRMSSQAMDVLMQMNGQSGMMPPPPSGGAGGGGASEEEVAEIFDSLDTNQDGTVSQDEFLAAMPEDVTEEQATAFFESMDTEGTGSITEEQLAAGMSQPPMGPPPGAPPMGQYDDLTAEAEESTASV
ncbi:EF-hand domain-containing protein [Rhizobium alvei]|uniref:EF-hand domain-containing protein n=1 Tax=Rhizobium alvei TaxID=1132659 RepID=A0ABT8YHQ8_9HYPH|nr:EF-hand domain-containing protein [Rhizobium alvei]MDO6963111.1 EF-hand domain-containing protein [Rhizobium alvei]